MTRRFTDYARLGHWYMVLTDGDDTIAEAYSRSGVDWVCLDYRFQPTNKQIFYGKGRAEMYLRSLLNGKE